MKCCICGKDFEGFGNNAEPIADGQCCDACNASEVIPARMGMAQPGTHRVMLGAIIGMLEAMEEEIRKIRGIIPGSASTDDRERIVEAEWKIREAVRLLEDACHDEG